MTVFMNDFRTYNLVMNSRTAQEIKACAYCRCRKAQGGNSERESHGNFQRLRFRAESNQNVDDFLLGSVRPIKPHPCHVNTGIAQIIKIYVPPQGHFRKYMAAILAQWRCKPVRILGWQGFIHIHDMKY